MPEYNEKEALALLAKGDERGLKAIYDRYARSIFVVCNRLLQDEEAAADVVQDLFIKLWGPSRTIFTSKKEFKPYFIRTAKNATLRALSLATSRQKHQFKYMQLQPENYCIDDEPDDKLALIMMAVKNLPPQRKAIFTLRYFDGLSHNDIAKQLGIAKATVNRHMEVAIKDIRGFDPSLKIKKENEEARMSKKITEMLRRGLPHKNIAAEFNLTINNAAHRINKILKENPDLRRKEKRR